MEENSKSPNTNINLEKEGQAQMASPVETQLTNGIPADGTAADSANAAAVPPPYPYQQPMPGYGYNPVYAPIPAKPKEPFSATRSDGWLALAAIPLGFLFVRWVLFSWQGWGVTAFTLLYAAAVLVYSRVKQITPTKESWFWLGIMLLTGASFSLWPGGSLAMWRSLLLFGTALYWCASLSGGLLQGKTGNFMPLDVLNSTLVVPFRNYALGVRSLGALSTRKGGKSQWKRILPVLMGLLVCVPLLCILLPLLLSADGGYFEWLLRDIGRFFEDLFLSNLAEYLWQLVLGVPVALFLVGLVAGYVHKRYVASFDVKATQKGMEGFRLVPKITIITILSVVIVTYIVFIACQISYFFSAFAGVKPEEFAVYSAYAREGFFELCWIAAINLTILLGASVFSKARRMDSRLLRAFNVILAAVTLLLISTAFSKMALYIQRHGFTQKRILTSVFMIFLAGVFIAVMVLQWKKFSIMRFAAGFGISILCALCLCNMDGMVVRYNTDRFMAGTLDTYETVIIEWAGPAGMADALRAYNSGNLDEEQKEELAWTMYGIQSYAKATEGESEDCLINAQVREMDTPAVNTEYEY